MQPQQLPSLDPILDQPRSQTQGSQLSPSNHTMLALGELADGERRPIAGCNALSSSCGAKPLRRNVGCGFCIR
jgi:hypothetical protein